MDKTGDQTILVENLNRKLALSEIEKQLTKVSCGLLDDELYSNTDAVKDLIDALSLIELEQQVVNNRISQL